MVLERYLFKSKSRDNHLPKFITIFFVLIGSTVLLEAWGSHPEQMQEHVIERLDSMRENLASFQPDTL